MPLPGLLQSLIAFLLVSFLVTGTAGQCSFQGTWTGKETIPLIGITADITAVYGGALSGSASEIVTFSFQGISCTVTVSGSFSATAQTGETNTYSVTTTGGSCKATGSSECSQACSSFNSTGGSDIAVFSTNCDTLVLDSNLTLTYQHGGHSAGTDLRVGWLQLAIVLFVLTLTGLGFMRAGL